MTQLALDFAVQTTRPRTGRERKADALAKIQGGNARWLEAVRLKAFVLACDHGEVTADDLAEHVEHLRVHRCPCGLVLDRDHNAALNVLRLGRSRWEAADAVA